MTTTPPPGDEPADAPAAHDAPGHTEPAHTGPAPTEPAPTEPAQAGPAHTGPALGAPAHGQGSDDARQEQPFHRAAAGEPGPGPAPRRVERRKDDRALFGVCAALARATDTDPVLWRVGLVALTLFGGSGVLLYVLGCVLIPEAGEPRSAGQRWLDQARAHRHDGRDWVLTAARVVAAVVILGFALHVARVVLSAAYYGSPGALVSNARFFVVPFPVVLALVVVLVLRGRRRAGAGRWTAPAGPWQRTSSGWSYGQSGAGWTTGQQWGGGWSAPVPTAGAGGNAGSGDLPAGAASATWSAHAAASDPAAPASWSAPVDSAPRPRSAVGRITFSAALLVAGALGAARLAGVEAITLPVLVAAALAVVGAGLVVSAWVGRARGLIALGLLLVLALGPATVGEAAASHGAGSRSWRVAKGTTAASYDLGVGEATLDLRELAPGVARMEAHVSIGHLLVLVPPRLPVHVVAGAKAGGVLLEAAEAGADVTESGSRVRRDARIGPEGPAVELDLSVGIGYVEVRHG